jgi:hypothetical protein
MCAAPLRVAAEQETRHGPPLSPPVCAPRARGGRSPHHPCVFGDGRRHGAPLSAIRRHAAGRGHRPRPRAVGDVPRDSRPPRRIGSDRLPAAGVSVRNDGCLDAADDVSRRLSLRAGDARARSENGQRPGAARPRALARARARRRAVGDDQSRLERALRPNRLSDLWRRRGAVLRHRGCRGHRLPGAEGAAQRAGAWIATRAGSSSGPSRRAWR